MQFSGDVFWRVSHIKKTNENRPATELPLSPRATNRFGDSESWHKDYRLDDRSEYSVTIESYIPGVENREIDPRTSVQAKEDLSKLLTVPDEPVPLRRNANQSISIGVRPFNFLGAKHAALSLTTVVTDPDADYEPGSIATLTLHLEKDPLWAKVALFSVLLSTVSSIGSAIAIKIGSYEWAFILGIAAAMFFWGGAYAWSGRITPTKSKG